GPIACTFSKRTPAHSDNDHRNRSWFSSSAGHLDYGRNCYCGRCLEFNLLSLSATAPARLLARSTRHGLLLRALRSRPCGRMEKAAAVTKTPPLSPTLSPCDGERESHPVRMGTDPLRISLFLTARVRWSGCAA